MTDGWADPGWIQKPVRVEPLPDGLWRIFGEHDGMYAGAELTVEVASADHVAEFITHPDGGSEARIRNVTNGVVLVRRGVGRILGVSRPEPLALAEIEGLADEEPGDRVWLVLLEVLANRAADCDEAAALNRGRRCERPIS